MFKNTVKGLAIILGVIFIYGCTASKGVEVRRYIEVKDRVDQNMDVGNAGYLSGTPKPEDRSNIRKTRKIYVLEISAGDPVDETVDVEQVADSENIEYMTAPAVEVENLIEVSKDKVFVFDVEEVDVVSQEQTLSSATVEYKVKKDDTLQKISKKFYDSFSKWPKIYDANRDVIDNPDRIKPGIIIQIPSE